MAPAVSTSAAANLPFSDLSRTNWYASFIAYEGRIEVIASHPLSPRQAGGEGSPNITKALMPGVFHLISSDLRAKAAWCYGDPSRTAVLKTLLTDGTAAMVWYRLMQWARRWRMVPLEMGFNKLNAVLCNCIIGRGAEFGPAFVLIHSTGVVINGQVHGGEHVYIEHQVTIGAERQQSPRLGDRVFIGAGAKIIGAVTIGDDVRIGANAVVVDDIPSGATAVGIPAKVVRLRDTGTKSA